jgi:hypothetical protein
MGAFCRSAALPLLVLLSLAYATTAAARPPRGGFSDGGGDPRIGRQRLFAEYISSGQLKADVITLAQTLERQPNLIQDAEGRQRLSVMVQRGLVQTLRVSPYRVSNDPADCAVDGRPRPASTRLYAPGAEVCWNIPLWADVNGSREEMIAVAIHEASRQLLGPVDDDHILVAAILNPQVSALVMRQAPPVVLAGGAVNMPSAPLVNSLNDPASNQHMVDELAKDIVFNFQRIAQIRRQIGVDTVVASVESKLMEMRQEKLISTKTRTANASLGGGLLALFGIGASASYESVRNITQILTVNAEEVARFPQKQARDFARLQSDVRTFIQSKGPEIAQMKMLALESVNSLIRIHELAQAARQRGISVAMPLFEMSDVIAAHKAVTELEFSGVQMIVHCVTTNYIGYTDSMNASGSASILFSSLSGKAQRTDQRFAREETTCPRNDSRTITESAGRNPMANVDMNLLDRAILSRIQLAQAFLIVNAPTPMRPHFGNPYFTQPTGDGISDWVRAQTQSSPRLR